MSRAAGSAACDEFAAKTEPARHAARTTFRASLARLPSWGALTVQVAQRWAAIRTMRSYSPRTPPNCVKEIVSRPLPAGRM